MSESRSSSGNLVDAEVGADDREESSSEEDESEVDRQESRDATTSAEAGEVYAALSAKGSALAGVSVEELSRLFQWVAKGGTVG